MRNSDGAQGTRGRILFIEDDALMQNMVADVLRASDYECISALDGISGLRLIAETKPDLVLLDLQLGALPTGLDICAQMRQDPTMRTIPVIVFTGEAPSTALEIKLFEMGADDFIEKQRFNPRVFIERIRAVMRRSRAVSSDTLEFGPMRIIPARREVTIDGRPVNLTPTEFDILYKLATNRERALSREELLDRGAGGRDTVANRTVDVHILSIRRKLGKHANLVATVHGVGYRLDTPVGVA
ncbi:MAG: response regulator transcription factor [Planctomycetota bacterium]|nr:response regulator transcription factor [Planctomycetota bacterium]